MTTKQVRGAISAGTRDAQVALDQGRLPDAVVLKDSRSESNLRAHLSNNHGIDELPQYGFIYNGTIMTGPDQLTRNMVDYIANEVYQSRVKSGHEPRDSWMPANWIGVYLIGAALRFILSLNRA